MKELVEAFERSQKRRQATRTIAFLYEDCGFEWTNLREALPFIAEACEIDTRGKRKSDIIIECLEAILNSGVVVPDDYINPWDKKPRFYSSSPKTPKVDKVTKFYDSWAWKKLSYSIRKKRGNKCECCGATPQHGSRIVADHIKPVRKYWHLRLNPTNIQVLCHDCNMGKGGKDTTDWRKG